MATLIYAEIEDLVLDALQANVTVDKPVATGAGSELLRQINDAYSQVWELSGGGILTATSAVAWSVAQTADTKGRATGLLTNIDEILHVWSSTTAGSVGDIAGDVEIKPTDLAEIHHLRQASGQPTYTSPKLYCFTRLRTAVDADVNKGRLDFWPGISGIYLPIEYTPMFTLLNATTITTPDVNDIESRDIAYLAAISIAPLVGRAELAPSIALKVSEKTRLGLERKESAKSYSKADR